MPYSFKRLGKPLIPGLSTLLLTAHVSAAVTPPIFFHSTFSAAHILGSCALYNYDKDSVLGSSASGYVRRDRDGSLVITVPKNAMGKYKIRFFDEGKALLFEIRQIMDPTLIVEKYNFQHAGIFTYDLYRDNVLIERSRFVIAVP